MPDRRDDLAHALLGCPIDGAVGAALDAIRVVIALPPRATADVAGAAAGFAAIASRIFGDVVVRGDAALGLNPWRVGAVAEVAALGSHGTTTTTEVVVAVGDNAGPADWYIGGDDFTAVVSRSPVAIRPCRHGGLGLQAGAAFAAGELLKTALLPFGMRAVVADCIVWNVLDGQLTIAPNVGDFTRMPVGYKDSFSALTTDALRRAAIRTCLAGEVARGVRTLDDFSDGASGDVELARTIAGDVDDDGDVDEILGVELQRTVEQVEEHAADLQAVVAKLVATASADGEYRSLTGISAAKAMGWRPVRDDQNRILRFEADPPA